jgi:hypothetical protein
MLRSRFSQILLLTWKLSTVFVIPIIIYFYISVMSLYLEGFNFHVLDEGQNIHKWIVFGLYLLYLLAWKGSNKIVTGYLKKFEFS